MREGMERVPKEFRKFFRDMAVVVADSPTPEQRRHAKVPSGTDLLGLYEGVPRTNRQYAPYLYPEKITLFQRSFEHLCGNDAERIRAEVAETVWHELAHALGMSEPHVRRVERRRRRRHLPGREGS